MVVLPTSSHGRGGLTGSGPGGSESDVRGASRSRCVTRLASKHKASSALERSHIFLLVLSQPLTCCAVLHPHSLSVQCARSTGAMDSQICLTRRA